MERGTGRPDRCLSQAEIATSFLELVARFGDLASLPECNIAARGAGKHRGPFARLESKSVSSFVCGK